MKLIRDEYHVYRDEKGKIIPCVSEILQEAGLTLLPDVEGDIFASAMAEGIIDIEKWGLPTKIPVEYMDKAKRFGTNVHLTCEYADKGILNLSKLDPAILPLLEQWKRFKTQFKAVFSDIERIVHSEKYNFCGTLDRIATLNGKKYIIDLKTTSVIMPSAGIQLEGYNIALGGGYKKIVVQLKADKYVLQEFKNPADKSVFLSCLQIWNWKKRNGKIKRGNIKIKC